MEKLLQFRDLKRQYEHIREDVDRVISDVIQSTAFISGSAVQELEKILSSYVNVRHCISCGNGTDAITIALRAILASIQEGGREAERSKNAVFVPDFTFFSTGECPANLGFPVYFVDVKKDTYNMNPLNLREAVESVVKSGKHKPFAVIAVDLFGQPAEFGDLRSICDEYGMYLIEDAAQGFGGAVSVGDASQKACSFADISTTSFFPAKPLGCYGDGGAIFTDSDKLALLCRSIAVHGKAMENFNDPMAKYNNVRLGYNSRLDTIQAGILLVKFPLFRDEELISVNRVASQYDERLKGIDGIKIPTVLDGYYSSWAQYTIQLDAGISRDSVQKQLKKKGIPTMVYYNKPMHQQEAFNDMPWSRDAECQNTVQLCENVLCLPIHPYLEEAEIEYVTDEIRKCIE